MSDWNQPYALPSDLPVAELGAEAREEFVARTYRHVFGAILGFTAIEVLLFTSGLAEVIARAMLSMNWLLVLGAFMVVSWLASRAAQRAESMTAQYLALAAFVVAEALIFVPLLFVANYYAPGAIQSAAMVTLLGFGGLTVIGFKLGKDFTFLGGLLRWGGVVVLVAIVAAVVFGFELGTYFSVGMIALAGGAILYDTSKVLHHYPEDRYVGAALELFASVALLFWYVLRLFMSRR